MNCGARPRRVACAAARSRWARLGDVLQAGRVRVRVGARVGVRVGVRIRVGVKVGDRIRGRSRARGRVRGAVGAPLIVAEDLMLEAPGVRERGSG